MVGLRTFFQTADGHLPSYSEVSVGSSNQSWETAMDMITDTTVQFDAEAVQCSKRAAAEMDIALAGPGAINGGAKSLMDLYDARNNAFENIEEGGKTEGYDPTADNALASALAQTIIDAPCLTIVDAAAKLGLVNDGFTHGLYVDEDAAPTLIDEVHSLIWRMAGGWTRGRDHSSTTAYEQAAATIMAGYGDEALRKGYRLETQEGNEFERWRYVMLASDPMSPLELAKKIAALAAFEGYGNLAKLATEGLGAKAHDVGLVGFVSAYRGALAMLTSAPPSKSEPGRIGDAISAITAKVRAFENETLFPANSAHSAAEAAYFASEEKSRTEEMSADIEALNRTWLDAAGVREGLITDLLQHEVNTASEALQLANAYVGLTVEQSYFNKDLDTLPHQWMLDEEKTKLLGFLMSSLERLSDATSCSAPVDGPHGAQSEWAAARSAFEAAIEMMNAAGDALSAAEAIIRAELDAAGADADSKAVFERHGYPALEQRWNDALNMRDTALETILHVPAPDMQALAFKAWQAAIDRTGSELDAPLDMKTLNELAESADRDTSILAALCQDIIRLGSIGKGAIGARDDAALIADIDDVIRLHAAAAQKSREGRDGAAGDFLDDADAPMQRLLKVRASTPEGLAARARLVEDWCAPVDILDREDLEWQLIAGLIEDAKAFGGATVDQVTSSHPELLAAE